MTGHGSVLIVIDRRGLVEGPFELLRRVRISQLPPSFARSLSIFLQVNLLYLAGFYRFR